MENKKLSPEENEFVKIKFYCKHCNKNHDIEIESEYFEDMKYNFTYTYVHGDPQIAAILYIDGNYVVRTVEFSEVFSSDREKLNDLLNRSKNLTLSNIPIEKLYGFQLLEGKKVIKTFYQQGYYNKIQFHNIKKIFKMSPKLIKGEDSCTEFYFKYSNFWAGGITMMDYMFFMVVDYSIDIDHFKTQIMALFETLLSEEF
jgi:hypothetical protein